MDMLHVDMGLTRNIGYALHSDSSKKHEAGIHLSLRNTIVVTAACR